MIKYLLPAVAALSASLGIHAQTPPTVTLPPEIDRVLRDYERAWSANDPDAVARLFAPDGMALPSGSPAARGAQDIRKVYAAAAGTPLSLRPITFATSGDLAYVAGGFGPAPDKPDFGKFTLVLKRAGDGRWLIASDMDNANAPMRPAPAPKK